MTTDAPTDDPGRETPVQDAPAQHAPVQNAPTQTAPVPGAPLTPAPARPEPPPDARRREDPDAALVPRLREGDEAAFRALVDRYGDDLFRLGCSIMGSEADAYDLVQETFVGAFRRVSAFDGRSSLRTWMLRILFNQASKAKRSRRLRQTVPLFAAETPARGTAAAAAAASEDATLHRSSAEPAVDARLDAAAMLQMLSEDHRQVLVLREIQRLSYAEIAAALDVPVGTVESRLYRARQEVLRRFPNYGR